MGNLPKHGLTKDQKKYFSSSRKKVLKRSVTCRKDEREDILQQYNKDGFRLVKSARNHGLYFLDFKKYE